MCIVTYKYECRVQILVMLLHGFPVIVLGLLAVMLVELGAEILLRQLSVLLLSVREVSGSAQRGTRVNLPIRRVSTRFPVFILPQSPSTILAVIKNQRAVTLGFLQIIP